MIQGVVWCLVGRDSSPRLLKPGHCGPQGSARLISSMYMRVRAQKV
jgi:hypothetical protein